jgi:hypothetical protein
VLILNSPGVVLGLEAEERVKAVNFYQLLGLFALKKQNQVFTFNC